MKSNIQIKRHAYNDGQTDRRGTKTDIHNSLCQYLVDRVYTIQICCRKIFQNAQICLGITFNISTTITFKRFFVEWMLSLLEPPTKTLSNTSWITRKEPPILILPIRLMKCTSEKGITVRFFLLN